MFSFRARREHGRDVIPVAALVSEAAMTMEPLCLEKGVSLSVACEVGESIITEAARP